MKDQFHFRIFLFPLTIFFCLLDLRFNSFDFILILVSLNLTIRKPSETIVARSYDQISDHASNYPNPSTSSFSTKSLISTCISISHMIAISFSISSSALLRTASASADDWIATVSTVTLFWAAIWISLWMVYKVLLESIKWVIFLVRNCYVTASLWKPF